jgi:hypothetical protein
MAAVASHEFVLTYYVPLPHALNFLRSLLRPRALTCELVHCARTRLHLQWTTARRIHLLFLVGTGPVRPVPGGTGPVRPGT